MKSRVGLGIILAFLCICSPGYASSGSIPSSPVIGSNEKIIVASSGAAPKGGAKHGGGDKKAEAGNGLMYEWDSVIVNLADGGGKRYLKVTMKMELTDAKLNQEMTERNYELQDAMIMVLSSKEYDDISTLPGKTRLKQEIIARMNKIVKNGQVKEIYFTDFIVQ